MSGSGAASEVTHASVLRIAVPMTLAFLSTPLVGFVDTAIIGQLGDPSLLGGIAIGAIIFDFVFVMFNFLRMGTTGLTAQAFGGGNQAEIGAVLWRVLLVSAVAGISLVAFKSPIIVIGLYFMAGSAEVSDAASTYMDVRLLAGPLTLANYAILGWLLGLGRAGTGLALQTILNGVNIFASWWLVAGLGWGVAGAAWGSVAGEAAATVAGLALIARTKGGALRVSTATVFDGGKFLRLFSVNRDIMIRSGVLIFAFAFFTAQGARHSDLVLAINAVLMNFFMIAGFVLDGFATAAEQLVGTAIGRKSKAMAQRAVRLTVGWGVVLGGVVSAILFLAGPVIIDFVTISPDVRAGARVYLVWAALTPLAGAIAFEFDGVYIGATWSRQMRNMMLISLVAAGCVWWAALPALGNHGLWLALHTFLWVRGFTLMAAYPASLRRSFSGSA